MFRTFVATKVYPSILNCSRVMTNRNKRTFESMTRRIHGAKQKKILFESSVDLHPFVFFSLVTQSRKIVEIRSTFINVYS